MELSLVVPFFLFTFVRNLNSIVMETEICNALRKKFGYTETDNFIMTYVGHYQTVYELICNSGLTIDEAVKSL